MKPKMHQETPASDVPITKPENPVTQSEKYLGTQPGVLGNISSTDSALAEIHPALDRAITRKFDTHLIPWLFGLWLLAFIDRSNIGLAKIDGLSKELDLVKGNKFNIVSPLT